MTLEGAKPAPMQKDDQGVWSLTTAPLTPDFYGYSFVADGVGLIDPSNPSMKPNLLHTQSQVHVPGPASLPWEIGDVPHGLVHHHFYKSGVVGDERDFYVYTPPGYDPKAKRSYPVLYLLHGFSDDASGWTAVGRANVILDNLIAQGKAKAMMMVMPLGYGAPEIVVPGPRAFATEGTLFEFSDCGHVARCRGSAGGPDCVRGTVTFARRGFGAEQQSSAPFIFVKSSPCRYGPTYRWWCRRCRSSWS